MARAELLAPCFIVTQDTVFSRFGIALIGWIPVVQNLLRLPGLEATVANALFFIELSFRLLGAGAHRLFDLAARTSCPRRPPWSACWPAGLLW
ncbi:hypothetical protein ACWEFD_34100 [Streptomyces ardesiacus]